MNTKNTTKKIGIRRNMLCVALGMCLASMATAPVMAANNDGTLVGRAPPNAEITVRSADTGFSRTVKADAEGNYRFPYLPIGRYNVESSTGADAEVQITLGNATTLNLGDETTSLETIEVIGSGTSFIVDLTSTESATNITREELQRLPVDRDPLSVALLAPGLTKGDNDLGGVSFGGSTVAENSVYINGLNVTDFYNRVGFSSVPFAFYREFQVKTGGYSVEFGRTTGGVINAVTR